MGEPAAEVERSAERMKFFTDAVVAIAMTLLILPLLESVTEAVHEELTTGEWLRENGGALFSFSLSFVIIASFWVNHHRLYERVEQYTWQLLWLNIAWMFTIVWLPVPTAMVGQLETDRLQVALYVGTMLANSMVSVAAYLAILRSPRTWADGGGPGRWGLSASLATVVLFTVALVVAVALPGIGYFALFALMLTGVVGRWLVPVADRLVPSAPAA